MSSRYALSELVELEELVTTTTGTESALYTSHEDLQVSTRHTGRQRAANLARAAQYNSGALAVGQERVDDLHVTLLHQRLPVEAALPLRGHLRENVALVGLAALDLARTGRPEALRCGAVGLHLGHDASSLA